MAKIELVRPAKDHEWDALEEACPHSTYFHTREWAEVWDRATAGCLRPWPRMVEFVDGERALLPISVRVGVRGLVRSYQSTAGGTYGGWLTERPLSDAHADTLSRYLRYGFGRLEWRLNPYDEQVLKAKFQNHEHDDTHVLDLRPGFKDVHRKWSKTHRSAVHQAHREGVTVRLAQSRDDWQNYYTVYQDSISRWKGRNPSQLPKELFEELGKLSSKRVRLWVAETCGIFVASALCLHAKSNVSYWHGTSLDSDFPRRPVQLLVYEAVQDACQREIRWFDFNPSGGHEGVEAFKRSFGAEPLSAPIVRVQPLWRRLAGVVGAAHPLKPWEPVG